MCRTGLITYYYLRLADVCLRGFCPFVVGRARRATNFREKQQMSSACLLDPGCCFPGGIHRKWLPLLPMPQDALNFHEKEDLLGWPTFLALARRKFTASYINRISEKNCHLQKIFRFSFANLITSLDEWKFCFLPFFLAWWMTEFDCAIGSWIQINSKEKGHP